MKSGNGATPFSGSTMRLCPLSLFKIVDGSKKRHLLLSFPEESLTLQWSIRHSMTSHSVGAKVPAREGSPIGKLILRRLGQTISATSNCGAFLVFQIVTKDRKKYGLYCSSKKKRYL